MDDPAFVQLVDEAQEWYREYGVAVVSLAEQCRRWPGLAAELPVYGGRGGPMLELLPHCGSTATLHLLRKQITECTRHTGIQTPVVVVDGVPGAGKTHTVVALATEIPSDGEDPWPVMAPQRFGGGGGGNDDLSGPVRLIAHLAWAVAMSMALPRPRENSGGIGADFRTEAARTGAIAIYRSTVDQSAAPPIARYAEQLWARGEPAVFEAGHWISNQLRMRWQRVVILRDADRTFADGISVGDPEYVVNVFIHTTNDPSQSTAVAGDEYRRLVHVLPRFTGAARMLAHYFPAVNVRDPTLLAELVSRCGNNPGRFVGGVLSRILATQLPVSTAMVIQCVCSIDHEHLVPDSLQQHHEARLLIRRKRDYSVFDNVSPDE